MITRFLQPFLEGLLNRHAAVGLLGPRQVGKTTMAKQLLQQAPQALYLDLERPSDRDKLQQPELFLTQFSQHLIVLDEIQRVPELFPILRGLIDERRAHGNRYGQFLILGSASLDLLQQASESLAGRIAYAELTPFNTTELQASLLHPCDFQLMQHWLRGGFPDAYLASSDAHSLEWRQQFIVTYLERDIPMLGPRIPSETLRRLWTMLAHQQGGLFNASPLASNLSTTGKTIERYVDLLVDLYLLRRLRPWTKNSKKRLTKAPKIYLRDSGLLHALLGIGTLDSLFGHPVVGASWEGFVIENILQACPPHTQSYYYRNSAGHEVDLILQFANGSGAGQTWAIEIKSGLTPKLTAGFNAACQDIQPQQQFVVYAGDTRYPMAPNIEAIPLQQLTQACWAMHPE